VLSPLGHADVEVLGLFKGAALLKVDGEQKLLKAGSSWKGITLIEADSRSAIAEIEGELQTLTVSQRIGTHYTEPANRIVRIPKNEYLQYITNAKINGRGTRVLVDTGANMIAMSSVAANSLGIKYDRGIPGRVKTASGVTTAYQIMLDSIDVGGIKVDRVVASVIEGSHPEMILLGTSFLEHVDMSEKDGVLMLMRKF